MFELPSAEATGIPLLLKSNLVNNETVAVSSDCDSELTPNLSIEFTHTWVNGIDINGDFEFNLINGDNQTVLDSETECQLFIKFYRAPRLLVI